MGTNDGGKNEAAELFQKLGYDLMAAAFDVYNELGAGFLEEVYQESFELELRDRRIEFFSKPTLELFYKGRPLQKRYEPDLMIAREVVVELKAVRTLVAEHEAQLINYLKATRKRVGYLINFSAHPRLQWKRFVL